MFLGLFFSTLYYNFEVDGAMIHDLYMNMWLSRSVQHNCLHSINGIRPTLPVIMNSFTSTMACNF